MAVNIAPSDPNRVYALIETGDGMPTDDGKETQTGQLWRSDDGGENWRVVSSDRRLRGRTHYYTRMAVAPDNEDEAYFLAARFHEDARRRHGRSSTSPATGRRSATITTCGSIRPTPAAWSSRTTTG